MILWILIATVMSVLPFVLIKYYTQTKNLWYIVACIIPVAILAIAYYFLLKQKSIGIVYAVVSSLSIILAAVLGYFLFKEKINALMIIGMITIILGIGMMSIK